MVSKPEKGVEECVAGAKTPGQLGAESKPELGKGGEKGCAVGCARAAVLPAVTLGAETKPELREEGTSGSGTKPEVGKGGRADP